MASTTISIRDAYGKINEIPISSVGTGGVYDLDGRLIYPDSLIIYNVERDEFDNVVGEVRGKDGEYWHRTITRNENGYITSVSIWSRTAYSPS